MQKNEKRNRQEEKEKVQNKDLVDEITLIGIKNGGHKRTSPSGNSVSKGGIYYNYCLGGRSLLSLMQWIA